MYYLCISFVLWRRSKTDSFQCASSGLSDSATNKSSSSSTSTMTSLSAGSTSASVKFGRTQQQESLLHRRFDIAPASFGSYSR